MFTFKRIFHYYVVHESKKIRYHVVEFLDGTKQLFTEEDWKELKELTKP